MKSLNHRKKMRGFLFPILIVLSVLFATPCVYASSMATITMESDWTSAIWSSDNPSQNILFEYGLQFTTPAAQVTVNGTPSGYNQQTYFDWGTHSKSSPYSGVYGTASATGSSTDYPRTDPSAEPTLSSSSSVNTTSGNLEADAYASRGNMGFLVSGAGTITFSFPYTVHVELNRGSTSDIAEVAMYQYMSMKNYGPILYGNKDSSYSSPYQYWQLIGSDLSLTEDSTGTMTISLHFDDGDYGYFTESLHTDAYGSVPTSPAVPLPGAVWLLGSGLLGLGGWRRFKKS